MDGSTTYLGSSRQSRLPAKKSPDCLCSSDPTNFWPLAIVFDSPRDH